MRSKINLRNLMAKARVKRERERRRKEQEEERQRKEREEERRRKRMHDLEMARQGLQSPNGGKDSQEQLDYWKTLTPSLAFLETEPELYDIDEDEYVRPLNANISSKPIVPTPSMPTDNASNKNTPLPPPPPIFIPSSSQKPSTLPSRFAYNPSANQGTSNSTGFTGSTVTPPSLESLKARTELLRESLNNRNEPSNTQT